MLDKLEAVRDVLAERQRQVETEGWTAEHDDRHRDRSLALTAALYATPIPLLERRELAGGTAYVDPWCWDRRWDKRRKHSERRRLVIAAALLLAEISRLDRAEAGRAALAEAEGE